MATHGEPSVHKTTETAIEILDLIAENNGTTLSDIEDGLNLAKSTAYTHLNTLQRHGFVVREGGRYWIGLRFRKYSKNARRRKPSYHIVEKAVRDLATETDAEIEFLVEENGRLNLVHHSENLTNDPVYLYLHNTAAGKAILADLPHERVTELLDRWGLPRETPNTITDREELLRELERVRDRGYAYNDGECFEGYHGIGAVVRGIDDEILGAVTVGGPVYRVGEENLKNEYSDALLATVDEIEMSIEAQRESIAIELLSTD